MWELSASDVRALTYSLYIHVLDIVPLCVSSDLEIIWRSGDDRLGGSRCSVPVCV